MEPAQYLESLARDSDLLADAAEAAGPAADVPTCPGWTVEDLVRHCTSGDLWARTIVETGSRSSPDLPADAPTGAALVPYFRDGARALVQTLGATDPAASVWTFSASDRTARFWYRRRAQETSVHRFDAQTAAGEPTPIDAELAVDGIDEFLTAFLPRMAAAVATDGETLHFHCTDVQGEWLVARDGEEVRVTREHAKGDVAARGGASDLLLFIWGRVPASRLEVFGDAAALDRFSQAVRV
jgi:uncharacterized protein (TIGR03083 family)